MIKVKYKYSYYTHGSHRQHRGVHPITERQYANNVKFKNTSHEGN